MTNLPKRYLGIFKLTAYLRMENKAKSDHPDWTDLQVRENLNAAIRKVTKEMFEVQEKAIIEENKEENQC